jgi:large subunit ribosomal protein L29
MKAKDLHERTVEDLKELEKTLSKDLFDARFKNFTNRLDDTALLNRNRREIARIKTVLALKAKGTSPATQKSPVAAAEKPIPKAAASKPAKKAAAPKADKPSKPAAKKTTKKTEKKA